MKIMYPVMQIEYKNAQLIGMGFVIQIRVLPYLRIQVQKNLSWRNLLLIAIGMKQLIKPEKHNSSEL